MDKSEAVAALQAALADELATVERVAAMARDEASNAETKQEGKYDTRATEASYLARGQAWRVVELRRLHAWFAVFDPEKASAEQIGVGSLVLLDGQRPGWVFVAPIGGPKATVGTQSVRLISPKAPLGIAMAGLEAGDAFEVRSPRGLVEYEVVEVR